MIGFTKTPRTLVAVYTLACDECSKTHEVVVDMRQADAVGGIDKMLASLEPYERAALSREGCAHAVPEPPAAPVAAKHDEPEEEEPAEPA